MIWIGIGILFFLYVIGSALYSIGKSLEGIKRVLDRGLERTDHLEELNPIGKWLNMLTIHQEGTRAEIKMFRETVEPVCKDMLRKEIK